MVKSFDRDAATGGQAGAAEPRQIGGIRIAKVTYEHHPLYAVSVGGTYGVALDDIIRQTFSNDPDAFVQTFNIEIGDEAAAALRDRCNRGEY